MKQPETHAKPIVSRLQSKYSWIVKRLIQIPNVQFRLVGQSSKQQCTGYTDTIMVVRPENIGDIVLLTSFLADLRQDYPRSNIVVAGRTGVISILRGDTRWDSMGLKCFDDNINVYDLPTPLLVRKLKAIYEYGVHIDKEYRPTYVVHPRPDKDLHLAGLFTSVFSRRSFGFSDNVTPNRKSHNPGADRYYSQIANQATGVHEVDRVATLLPLLGSHQRNHAPYLIPNESNITLEVESITLGIGAASVERELPDDIAEGILRFLSANGFRVFIVGAKVDSARARKLLASVDLPSRYDICGQCTLDSVGHVIGQSKLYIGPDSGLMHIAAAVGVQVIAISAYTGTDSLHSNSPDRFGPANKSSKVIRPLKVSKNCGQALDIGSVCLDEIIQTLGKVLNV